MAEFRAPVPKAMWSCQSRKHSITKYGYVSGLCFPPPRQPCASSESFPQLLPPHPPLAPRMPRLAPLVVSRSSRLAVYPAKQIIHNFP